MFPTSAFHQASMSYPFPGQQISTSTYQPSYGAGFGGTAAAAGFNPQVAPYFQQGSQLRGHSLGSSSRQYTPLSSSSRHHKHGQYPPPASSHRYEHRSSQGLKSKKHHKQRSVSPKGVVEQSLYSDHEQKRRERSEGYKSPSRSQSPALGNHLKQEEVIDNDREQQQQQQAQSFESTRDDTVQGEIAARPEETQVIKESEKRKSSSKKKKHHRRGYWERRSIPTSQDIAVDRNGNKGFQQLYPQSQQYSQQPTYFGEYQNELPPQLKVHRQPLYNGYNQAYEESVRRGDAYHKYEKRSTLLPPEVKQQLLPHEDDQNNQPQSVQQQTYPFGSAPGYFQQPFGGIRPPFNRYLPYGHPPVQSGYYGVAPGSAASNALQPWPNRGGFNGPPEQEIQHLLNRIHTLEDELHKLQRKFNKATLNNEMAAGGHDNQTQDEGTHSHRRSKRDSDGSPRQTPVITELDRATAGDTRESSSSKKHRRRTTSNTSFQKEQRQVHRESAVIRRSENTTAGRESTLTTSSVTGQNQPASGEYERSQLGGNRTSEAESRHSSSKSTREETAAQLAHAAAAHVNNRQGSVGVSSKQQAAAPPPLPPPSASIPKTARPPLSNQQQQQQQQQFMHQQAVLPPQRQQMRGRAPYFPVPGNIPYPGDPHQQQQFINQQQQEFINTHQTYVPNPNYNQSNNNELYDDDDDDEQRYKQEEPNRSAEKILDAFERYYISRGKPTAVPMKVKYIPEENNSNQRRSKHHQLNTKNNNRYCSTNRQSRTNSSSSESESLYSNSSSSRHSLRDKKSITGPFI